MAERLELKPGIYRNGKFIARSRHRSNYTAQPGDIEVKSGSFNRNPVTRVFTGGKWPASPTRLTNAKDVPDSLRSHTQLVERTGTGRKAVITRKPLDEQESGQSFGDALKIGEQFKPGEYKDSKLNIPFKEKDSRPSLYGDSESEKFVRYAKGPSINLGESEELSAQLKDLRNNKALLTSNIYGKNNKNKASAASELVESTEKVIENAKGPSYEDVLKMKRGKKRDELTLKHWTDQGYTFEGLSKSDRRELANELRIRDTEFTGSKGTFIHFGNKRFKKNKDVLKIDSTNQSPDTLVESDA